MLPVVLNSSHIKYLCTMHLVPSLYYILDMPDRFRRVAKTIRMRADVYHQARVAAVISGKSVGQWIEEAVLEKEHREAVHPLPGSKGRPNPVRSVGQATGRQIEGVAELPTG